MTSKNQTFESKLLIYINYLEEHTDVDEVDNYYQKCMENKKNRYLQNITNVCDSDSVISSSTHETYNSNINSNSILTQLSTVKNTFDSGPIDFDGHMEYDFSNEYGDYNSYYDGYCKEREEEEYTNEEIDAAFEEAERWADF